MSRLLDEILGPAVLDEIASELISARRKHPEWPDSLPAQGLIIMEESGELAQAINNYWYHDGERERIRKEAIHTIVTCLRLIDNG